MKVKAIFRPICWINTLWLTLMNPEITVILGKNEFVWFSGHKWQEMDGAKPTGSNPLKCDICGLKEND